MTRLRPIPPDEWVKCGTCLGSGQLTHFFGQAPVACSRCKGTGELPKPAERPKVSQ